MSRLQGADGHLRPTLHGVVRRAHMSVALIAVATAGLALTLAGLIGLRAYADHNLHLIARSMSYTAEAAVVFHDRSAAQEALALIAATEDVAEAQVLDRHGQVLASWHAHEGGLWSRLEQQVANVMLPPSIALPITHEGVQVGEIRLRGQGAVLLQFLFRGLASVLACLALSIVSALYLSRRMQSGITAPLQALAKVAHAVHRERVFERRVPPTQIAELNELGEDFNALLDVLEDWQRQLQHENEFLAHQALHDSLTGLPNRAFFESRLTRGMREAAKSGSYAAVLFLDCDRFKEINDGLGHAAGDVVLVNIASRIKGQLREDDLVARLGGDEFAVLLAPLQTIADASRIADSILGSMSEPISLPGGGDVIASLSIGIAVFPDHANDARVLLAGADAAMYRAKRLRPGSWEIGDTDDFETLAPQ
jgi:diguanylate cyclase (GGDEF)-like protein